MAFMDIFQNMSRFFLEESMKTPTGLVNVYSLLWKMTIEIVDFPIEHGDFSKVMLVYQRVYIDCHEMLRVTQCCWTESRAT